MTRNEAIALKVGVDKIWIVESRQEEIYDATVTGVALDNPSRLSSDVKVTGYNKAWQGRVYAPAEIFGTEIEAMQHLSSIHELRSDQSLNKKHALTEKIAKLKKKENRNG